MAATMAALWSKAAAAWEEATSDKYKSTVLYAGAAAVALPLAFYMFKRSPQVVRNGKYKGIPVPAGAFDVCIVGAGPSGSVMGYYAVKGGAKVALLDKEKFPRDKYCGDAVCTPAIEILRDMGVMAQLERDNQAHYADKGGFVSPGGLSYIGNSEEKLGMAACAAVKRINMDEKVARCAQKAGCQLTEGAEVTEAKFSPEEGLWTVTCADKRTFKSRVLVCADGALSKLARKLGLCNAEPQGICSRAFVEAGTHNTDFDGVCFYPKESLPGYAAIFKHPNDELNFCYYLIPCGRPGMCGDVSEDDLARLHNDAIKSDPYISRALGPNVKIERMRAAKLRLGSQGVPVSYAEHTLIIGDAAGHIDPLTGEGIHTAMQGGKAAAQTLLEMIAEGDYSARSCAVYEARWKKLFGDDFWWSMAMAQVIYRFPILLDACCAEIQRKGDRMMAKWAEIMTGMQPKTYFLQPHVAMPLGIATVREFITRLFVTRKY